MGVIMGVCTVFRSKPALIATIVSIAAIKLLELRSVATGDDSGAGIAITAVVFTTMFFVPQALSLFQIVTSKDQKDDIPKEVSNVSEVIEEVKNEKLEEQESISQDL